jgi:hypothetical protein
MFFSSGVFGSEVRVSEKTVSLRDPPEAGLTKSGLFLFNSYQFRGSAFVVSLPAREITEKNGHFDRNAVKWRNPYKHISENV